MTLIDSVYKVVGLETPAGTQEQADLVARSRRYYEGDHDFTLTDDMRTRLRISDDQETFNNNYIPIIIETEASRLTITGFQAVQPRTQNTGRAAATGQAAGTGTPQVSQSPKGESSAGSGFKPSSQLLNTDQQQVSVPTDPAQDWVDDLMDHARFDVISQRNTKAMLRDTDSFILVSFNKDDISGLPDLTLQEAYDGEVGMFPIYADQKLFAAARVWREVRNKNNDKPEPGEELQIITRVNIYYADRIERYKADGDTLTLFDDPVTGDKSEEAWGTESQPIGVPVVHFINRPIGVTGRSEIKDALPLQDVLNRAVYSLAVAIEAHGFSNRVAIGFDPDANEEGLAPGDWIVAGADGVEKGELVDVKNLQPGDLTQLINAARFLAREIGNITMTPAPEIFDSDSLSGRGFQARETSLVAKCRAFQIECGAAWEQVIDLAWSVQAAFGQAPPDYLRMRAIWQPIDLISNWELVDNAVKIMQVKGFSLREFLRSLKPVYEWDDTRIEQIIAEIDQEKQQAVEMAIASKPPQNQTDQGGVGKNQVQSGENASDRSKRLGSGPKN